MISVEAGHLGLRRHQVRHYPAVNKNQDSQLCQRVISKAREQILPNAKKLIGAINF